MIQKNVLHCVIDEKFIDGAISLFDCEKQWSNTYVLFARGEITSFKYIKNNNVAVHRVDDFDNVIRHKDIVILHSFNCVPYDCISRIGKEKKVVWLSWGYDMYNENGPIVKIKMHQPITEGINKTLITAREKLSLLKRDAIFQFIRRGRCKYALSRVDYYSGVFPYEYELIKKHRSEFRAQPIDFYYGSIDFFIPDIIENTVDNKFNSILVGNSADSMNNHLDAFEYIYKNKWYKEYDIICPLSYAGTKQYIDIVNNQGSKYFGSHYKPLLGYLPFDEYSRLVSTPKIAIYFHERQQASDNVFLQLWNGAVVFMSETSLMYQYLREAGFYIYSMQKDFGKVTSIDSSKVIHNRRLLVKNYSRQSLIDRIHQIAIQIK